MAIRFGPAGLGPTKDAMQTLERYHKQGIRACEIAFVHNIYIKNKEDAERIGKKAKELDIALSIHAPYYVNLGSDKVETRKSSIARIIECCGIGETMGANAVVFHPGYYGKDRAKAYDIIRESVKKITKEIIDNGWKIKACAETMGKVNVFGSLDEIRRLSDETGCGFCIDFAHILARDKKVDYGEIDKMFPEKKWHCHFSGIVYGDKGEKNHIETGKGEWKELLKNLPADRDITIINESPSCVEDSVEGLKIYEKIL